MSREISAEKLGELIQEPNALEKLVATVQPETIADMRQIMSSMSELANADLPDVGATVLDEVAINDHMCAMVVVPAGEGPFPVICYIHGGGWVCGHPRDYQKLLLRFAERGFLCVAPDYRLAPEFPFPTPFDDCLEAYRWTVAHCDRWGGDPARAAIAGDSAGGNFSAAVAAALHGEPDAPKACGLIYGAFDFALLDGALPTDDEGVVASGNSLSTRAYLGDDWERLLTDPRVSPIHVADKLPPCHIVVGGEDLLVKQCDALEVELKAHEIPYEYYIDDGMPHGYFQLEVFPQALVGIERLSKYLHTTL